MYFTSRDTQQYTLNNKVIIPQGVVEWNRELNKIFTMKGIREDYTMLMWITFQKIREFVIIYPQTAKSISGSSIIINLFLTAVMQ